MHSFEAYQLTWRCAEQLLCTNCIKRLVMRLFLDFTGG